MLTKEKEMERITLSSSSANDITILVVDDDTTCLSIVAALLKKFRYEGICMDFLFLFGENSLQENRQIPTKKFR